MSESLEVTYHPPQLHEPVFVRWLGTEWYVHCGKDYLRVGRASQQPTRLALQEVESQNRAAILLDSLLDFVFAQNQEAPAITVTHWAQWPQPQAYSDFFTDSPESIEIPRTGFYQRPGLFLGQIGLQPQAETWVQTGGQKHPQRRLPTPGVLYRRRVTALNTEVSFRTLDIDGDLERFHQWHHTPRVFDLWELNQSKEELRQYLKRAEQDPRQIPAIVEYGGRPVGYFEFYWAAEDRIAPHCEAQPFDRGLHFLIGEDDVLGRQWTEAALTSATHYLFLDDHRTRRLVAEPRSDNQRVIKYVDHIPGWRFVKEFDFPHKRSALLTVRREDFFLGEPRW
jgi:RimJ/RimL family protein N-acetyltransferase